MRTYLDPHLGSDIHPAMRVAVAAERTSDNGLALCYSLIDPDDRILLPPCAETSRADDLWRHSCCEAFIRTSRDAGYHEFNFAPSSRWAAYRFDAYRRGMAEADILPPRILTNAAKGLFSLTVTLDLPFLPSGEPWQLALSAVMENRDGGLSYWALLHPPGPPDFHHPDCFTLELPAPETP